MSVTASHVVHADEIRGSYGRHMVFASLSLDIGPGVTGLLGPNGAGKTTLLHLLAGLKISRPGVLEVLGHDMRTRAGRRSVASAVGFLPQTFGFVPNYTVKQTLSYAAWLKRVPNADVDAAVASAVEAVDLSAHSSTKMKKLSGGMIRRVGIAAAIVHRPKLLILDEPAAGLDPAQRARLRDLTVKLGTRGAVLVSTHLIDDVEAVCDDLLVIESGIVRFHGTPDELVPPDGAVRERMSRTEAGYLAVLGRSAGEEVR